MQTIEIDGMPHMAMSIEDVEMLVATFYDSDHPLRLFEKKVKVSTMCHAFLRDKLVKLWIKKNRT